MADEKAKGPEVGGAEQMELFRLATIAAMIDNVRFRIHHMEVTWKGDKAGPYEASQIPPPLTPHKAYELLQEMWEGVTGAGPEVDELLMGSVVLPHGHPGHEEEADEHHVDVPGIDTEMPFELEGGAEGAEGAPAADRPGQRAAGSRVRQIRKAPQAETVVPLQPEEESGDDEESGVIELEAE
jgi:hypothetical protein